MARKKRDILAELGFGSSSTSEVDSIERQIENLRTRLSSQGIDASPRAPKKSLLDKTLRTLSIPGAAIRGGLRAAVDPNFDVGDISLWENQTSGIELLDSLGLAPAEGAGFGRKAARFGLGLAADVVTDPLSFLQGGITSPLRVMTSPVGGRVVANLSKQGLAQPLLRGVGAGLKGTGALGAALGNEGVLAARRAATNAAGDSFSPFSQVADTAGGPLGVSLDAAKDSVAQAGVQRRNLMRTATAQTAPRALTTAEKLGLETGEKLKKNDFTRGAITAFSKNAFADPAYVAMRNNLARNVGQASRSKLGELDKLLPGMTPEQQRLVADLAEDPAIRAKYVVNDPTTGVPRRIESVPSVTNSASDPVRAAQDAARELRKILASRSDDLTAPSAFNGIPEPPPQLPAAALDIDQTIPKTPPKQNSLNTPPRTEAQEVTQAYYDVRADSDILDQGPAWQRLIELSDPDVKPLFDAVRQAPASFHKEQALSWLTGVTELDRQNVGRNIKGWNIDTGERDLYRDILSSGSRVPLKRGETWRGRVINYAKGMIQKAQQNAPPPSQGATTTQIPLPQQAPLADVMDPVRAAQERAKEARRTSVKPPEQNVAPSSIDSPAQTTPLRSVRRAPLTQPMPETATLLQDAPLEELPDNVYQAFLHVSESLQHYGNERLRRGMLGSLLRNYFPHKLTPEATEALGKNFATGAGAGVSQQSGKLRGIKDTLANIEKTEFAPGFEREFVRPFAKEVIESERAIQTFDFFEDITKQFGISADDMAKRSGFAPGTKLPDDIGNYKLVDFDSFFSGGKQRATSPQTYGKLGKVYLPAEVADDMSQIYKAYHTDEGTSTFLKMWDGATNFWRPLVTTVSIPFHINNAFGNLWNSFLGGMENPQRLKDGYDIFWKRAGNVKAGAHRLEFGQVRELAEKYGVINSGIFENEVGADVFSLVRDGLPPRSEGNIAKVVELLSPVGKAGGAVKGVGDKVAAFVEGTSRAALFTDNLMKRVSAASGQLTPQMMDDFARQSAEHVNKYLFDYAHGLSKTESTIARRVMPFYSWCVPTDVKILTKEGWKTHDQLQVGEQVLTYNVDKDITEWQPVKEVAIFDYDGPMTRIKGRSVNFLCTPNHRWPVKQNYVRDGEKHGRKIVLSHELNSYHSLIQGAPHTFSGDSILSPRDAAILGWVVTDGYSRWRANKGGKTLYNEMMIYQSPGKHLQEIIELVGEEGVAGKAHPDTGVVPVRLSACLRRRLIEVFNRKDNLPEIVTRLSREAAEAMYDAMMKAEASVANRLVKRTNTMTTEATFNQNHGPVLEAFRILAMLLGKVANRIKKGAYIRHHRHVKTRPDMLTTEEFKGRVWCPVTENGTWVMDADGCAVMTGNTKFNIPLQVAELIDKPGKFLLYDKVHDNMASINPPASDTPPWLLEGFSTGVGTADGGQVFFNPRLPLQDISRLAPGDTGRNLLGMVNPMAKLLFEMNAGERGFNLFTGRPIADYAGETTEVLPGVRVDKKTAHLYDSLSGSVGRIANPVQAIGGEADSVAKLRGARFFFPGLFTANPEKQRRSNAYAETQRLRDLLRKYEDESGEQVPTLKQLGL